MALYEACAVEDAFYLISELVHGETLAQLIAAGGLADEEVLEIGVALADALSHAHSRGVIHRDVKPQNVLVPAPRRERSAGPRAKLTDFGGARLAGEDVLTRTGDVLGTLAYMAPEQSEGREVGEAADLYALALVLYEALSGVNPVRGSTPAATARRIGRPLAPLEAGAGPAARAHPRARPALAPSPADRGTLEELRLALEEALRAGLPAAPPRPSQRAIATPEDPAGARGSRPRAARRPRMAGGPAPTGDAPTPGGPGRAGAVGGAHAARARGPGPPPTRRPPGCLRPSRTTPVHARGGGMDPALPRAIWLGCALAVIIWQAWIGRPGVALLALRGRRSRSWLLPPPRVSAGWLVCALAPLLGLAGLAGAFPAIAGQATRWRARAALGALGYWWLILAEPLLARRLWLGHPARDARQGRVGGLASPAPQSTSLGPMLSLGVLLGAALWAAAAVVLPWIVRGRSGFAGRGRRSDLVGRDRPCRSLLWTAACPRHPRTCAVRCSARSSGARSPWRPALCAAPSDVAWPTVRSPIPDRPAGPSANEPAEERRDHDRQPRRGRLRAHVPLRGAPDGARAQARPRDG